MNKRIVYHISQNHDQIASVHGRSFEEAAKAYARKAFGRKCTAFRTSGTFGLSGYFRAYEPAPGGGWSSIGEPFHVQES